MTEIVFILDRSGSMAGLEADTIGGFNGMIDKQRGEPGEALVSTVLFDHETQVVHDRVPLDRAVRHIANVHKYARPEDRPEKTLFVITTDGMENASRRYTYEQVKAMIQRQREKYGWEFLFLGANIDAAKEAGRFGIAPERAADYCCDSRGTALNFRAVGRVMGDLRASRPVEANWREEIDRDFRARGRRG